jgi:hypothetical protein
MGLSLLVDIFVDYTFVDIKNNSIEIEEVFVF